MSQERFWAKVQIGAPNECWPWMASLNRGGYGRFNSGGHHGPIVLAHRYSYELLVRPIPGEMTIHHLCFNRACVNPSHLDVLSRPANSGIQERMFNSHCPNGHEFTDENTYRSPTTGHRHCITCRDEGLKAFRSRRVVLPLALDDPRHGSDNGYNYYRCRCEACRKAHQVRMAQRTKASAT